ncbi:hypothetical protein GTZ99_00585 [Novosphingobium sp. FSY-8]|uniref:VanZ like protein n=1 Tax=Novosphingobium ovatum TaxID=1908523 RepID=A0ABW9X959_9SPHN|nr:hypothetical protein [Novosphingobium ovatum]NBC35049.1 hypothetical protein [Novosphingobium ovatum]
MTLVHRYIDLTNWLETFVPGPDKFLHVCAGLIIWLVAGMVLRRGLHTPWPMLMVVLAETANECVDRLQYGDWQWAETGADVAATVVWPLVLTLALRYLPVLRRDAAVPAVATAPAQ